MNTPTPSYSIVFDSPLGRLGAQVTDTRLLRLDYLAHDTRRRAPRSEFERKLVRQIENYFDDPGARFSIALTLAGTPFQQRVWQALTTIPPGETLTYGELAARLDTGARAVGNACRRNPVSIIVPCHRVVAAGGMGGYSGRTGGEPLERKSWLLAHENQCAAALKTPDSAPHRPIQTNT